MSSARLLFSSHVAIFLAALAACGDSHQLLGPANSAAGSVHAASSAPRTPARSITEVFWEIAGNIPEFGGAYVDESGAPVVVLTDTNRLFEAAEAVRAALVTDLDTTFRKPIRAQKGDHGFRILTGYYEAIIPRLVVSGLVSTDVDEVRNRVRIAVANKRYIALVENAIVAAAVPPAAVLIEVDEPAHFASTLSDYERPVPGGYKILGGDACAIGINASTSGTSRTGYLITPSHCTGTIGLLDEISFYQPDPSAFFHRIGREVRDVTFFTGGACPPLRVCSYADAALVQYDVSYNDMEFGYLAQTAFRSGPLGGSGSVDVIDRHFLSAVDGYTTLPPVTVGTEIDKIGPVTGWTYGSVSATDVDLYITNSSITLLRQVRVSASATEGDSGAPVFQPGGWFRGILVASNESNTQYFYSTMPNIINALDLNSFPLYYCWC